MLSRAGQNGADPARLVASFCLSDTLNVNGVTRT